MAKRIASIVAVSAVMVSVGVSCDLFKGTDSLIKANGRGGDAAIVMPESKVTYDGDELRFVYKRGNDAASKDRAMRAAVNPSRSAAGFVPGENSDGTGVSDYEEAINVVQMVVINADYPTEIADMDESFDDTGAAISVSCSVARGSAYHVLFLIGNKDNAGDDSRTLLKSGYVYLTTNAVDNADNVLVVPLYPIVIGTAFMDTVQNRMIEPGRMVKRIGLNENIESSVYMSIGSSAAPVAGEDDTLFSVGGNGLYPLQQAEWMLTNAATTPNNTYDGTGSVHFADSLTVITNTSGNEAIASDPGRYTASLVPLDVSGASGLTPQVKLSFDDDGAGATYGVQYTTVNATAAIAPTLAYYPFGIDIETGSDQSAGAWWNFAGMRAWKKTGGFGSTWKSPLWQIRNGLNDDPSSQSAGIITDDNAPVDADKYGNGGICVIVEPSDETVLLSGIYEEYNFAPLYGSHLGEGSLSGTMTGSPGDLARGLSLLNTYAKPHGNYTIRLADNETGLRPNASLASYTNLLGKDITLSIEGVGTGQTLTLAGTGALFDRTANINWNTGARITVISGAAPAGPVITAGNPGVTDYVTANGTDGTFNYNVDKVCTVTSTVQSPTWKSGNPTTDDIDGAPTKNSVALTSAGNKTEQVHTLTAGTAMVWYAYAKDTSTGEKSSVVKIPVTSQRFGQFLASDLQIDLAELFQRHHDGAPSAAFDLGIDFDYPETSAACLVPFTVVNSDAFNSEQFKLADAASWKRGPRAVTSGESFQPNFVYTLTLHLGAVYPGSNIFADLTGTGGFNVAGFTAINGGTEYNVTVAATNVTAGGDEMDLVITFPAMPAASL